MAINGTSGDDTLTGTSGNDIFNLGQGGNDTVSGLGGNDTFRFGATFTAADHVDGGTGNDTVELNGDYSAGLTLGAGTIVAVEAIVVDAGFNYALTLNDGNVAAGNRLSINASALTDGNTLTFNGSAETDGTLYVTGGTGDDSITMGAHLTTADRLNGGSGNDKLFLDGNYTMTFTTTTLRNISDLVLSGGGHSYDLITNDATVAAGASMTVDGTSLGAGNSLTFNGSHETDGSFFIEGGSGGVMVLTGSAGEDVFVMGDGLTNSDRLNGGTGDDALFLSGNYTLSLAAATLRNIVNLELGGGHNYHLISGGNTGNSVSVVATPLGAGDSLYFDAHKESGAFTFVAGAGAATLIGGTGNDAFDFDSTTSDMLTASDRINGGAGNDVVNIDGLYMGGGALVFSATTMTNVETLVLGNSIASNCYDITTADATVAAGQTLTVDGSQLTASQSLTFNGAAETDGSFDILGGADFNILTGGAGSDTFDLTHGGADTVSGGGGNDGFLLGASLTAADQIDGGTGGGDALQLDGNYTGANALVFNPTTMVNIDNLYLLPGASNGYDITTDDATVAAGASLVIQGGTLTTKLTFNGSAETDGGFYITGGKVSDVLTGGAQADRFVYDKSIGITGAVRDTIHAFDFANDVVQFADVSGIAAAFTVGSVNNASIDADLQTIVNSSRLPANDAVLYTAKTGNLAGHTFLIVDGNGIAGYQTGSDLVIELSGALHTGSMNIDNFIE